MAQILARYGWGIASSTRGHDVCKAAAAEFDGVNPDARSWPQSGLGWTAFAIMAFSREEERIEDRAGVCAVAIAFAAHRDELPLQPPQCADALGHRGDIPITADLVVGHAVERAALAWVDSGDGRLGVEEVNSLSEPREVEHLVVVIDPGHIR